MMRLYIVNDFNKLNNVRMTHFLHYCHFFFNQCKLRFIDCNFLLESMLINYLHSELFSRLLIYDFLDLCKLTFAYSVNNDILIYHLLCSFLRYWALRSMNRLDGILTSKSGAWWIRLSWWLFFKRLLFLHL